MLDRLDATVEDADILKIRVVENSERKCGVPPMTASKSLAGQLRSNSRAKSASQSSVSLSTWEFSRRKKFLSLVFELHRRLPMFAVLVSFR